MPAPTSCFPCQCIPGNVGNEYFKQAVISALCQILAATGGGGVFSEGENIVLCDDNGPFLRHILYANGVQTSVSDTTLDGLTPYIPVGTVTLCPVQVNASFQLYAPPDDTRQFDTDPFNSVLDQVLMPAVVGNRNYVTTLTFSNSSVDLVRFIVKDGATKIYSIYVDAETSETVTFPVALRGGVNSDINVATDAAITNALVAGAGYISIT